MAVAKESLDGMPHCHLKIDAVLYLALYLIRYQLRYEGDCTEAERLYVIGSVYGEFMRHCVLRILCNVPEDILPRDTSGQVCSLP